MNLVFTSNFPTTVIGGIRFLCLVLSIRLLNSIRRPGMRVNTERRLIMIALIRTTARSRPIRKCIKASAARPDTVVREEDEISGIALLKAAMQASLAGLVSCSSLNL